MTHDENDEIDDEHDKIEMADAHQHQLAYIINVIDELDERLHIQMLDDDEVEDETLLHVLHHIFIIDVHDVQRLQIEYDENDEIDVTLLMFHEYVQLNTYDDDEVDDIDIVNDEIDEWAIFVIIEHLLVDEHDEIRIWVIDEIDDYQRVVVDELDEIPIIEIDEIDENENADEDEVTQSMVIDEIHEQ